MVRTFPKARWANALTTCEHGWTTISGMGAAATSSQLLPEQDLKHLGRLTGDVARPFVLVCGGAKVDDKLPVIRHLGARADEVLLGGKLAEKLRISNPLDFPVRLPMDVVGVPRLAPDAESRICAVDELPYGWTVLDIGPRTASEFSEVIAGAGTVFWSGPMGLFEWPRFAGGTDTIARAVAESNAFSVAIGVDTLSALNGLGLLDHVSWAAGGGAVLDLLAGEELPGVAVIPPA